MLRTPPVILLTTALLLPALAGLALPAIAQSTSVEVTLRVAPEGMVVPSHWAAGNQAIWLVDPVETTTLNDQPGIAGCQLTVPDGNGDGRVDGGEVLDHATATGCISGWDHETSDCCGRFVTSVDGVDELGWPATWWLIHVDGTGAAIGIDGMALQDGQSLAFVYYAGT